MRFDTPDQVIGIGGAGKEIVYELLSPGINSVPNEKLDDLGQDDLREWLIDEVLEPRGQPMGEHTQVRMDTFVVDTDTDEAGNDRSKTRRITNLLEEREKNHPQNVTGPTLEYVNIVEDADTKARHLLNESQIRTMKQETGLSCWWIDSGPDMIDPHDDFGGGVFRRRAIGKALYGMSQIGTNDPIKGIRDAVSANSDVAMVVGIGGGTGSGTFLDIARTLKENNGFPDVTLFAILPHFDEDQDRAANAYAALSELEYLSLTHQEYFKNIVLIPQQSAARRGDFDESIVRTILSYYTLNSANHQQRLNSAAGPGPGRFAPFTVAATQVLQYEGETIKEAKEWFNNYYQEKERHLTTEEELYEDAEKFLETYYGEDSPGENVYEQYDGRGNVSRFSLDDEEVSTIKNRLDDLEELVNLEVLPSIGCTVAEDLQADFSNAKDLALQIEGIDKDEAPDGVVDRTYVERVPEQSETTLGSSPGEDKPEDQRLVELYRRELAAIRQHRDLLCAKNMIEGLERGGTADAVDTSTVSNALEMALAADVTVKTDTDVEDLLDELDEDIRERRQRISDFETIETALEKQRDEDLEAWADSVASDVQTLASRHRNSEELEGLLDSLESALDGAEEVAHMADSTDDIPEDPRIDFDEFERLNELLRQCGLDQLPEDEVRAEVGYVWNAKREWLRDSEGGIIFGGPDTEELQRNHSDYYRRAQNSDLDMAWVPQWDKRPDESGSLRKAELDRRREALDDADLADEIETSVVEYIEEASTEVEELLTESERSSLNDPDLLSEFVVPDGTVEEPDLSAALARLESEDPDDVLDDVTAEGGVVFETFDEAYLGTVEHELTTATDRLSALKDAEALLETIEDLLEAGSEFAADAGDLPSLDDIVDVDEEDGEDGTYITTEPPENPGELLTNDDIGETDFWTREGTNLRMALMDFTNRIENDLLPIRNGSIAEPTENPENSEYDEHRVVASFMSRAFPENRKSGSSEDAAVDPVKSSMTSELLSNVGQVHWNRVRFGGPWDLTMTMFLGGVMFDNLDIFEKSGKGLKDKYESERTESTGRQIVNRHAHGIDGRDAGRREGHDLFDGHDGAYLFRESILNLTVDTEDKLLVLNNLDREDVLIEELLNRHEIVGIDSVFDLSDD